MAPPAFGYRTGRTHEGGDPDMVILGVVLLIIGLIADIAVLTTLGIILAIIGLILNLVPIRGTRHMYY
jgi:hypothetical protein